jgi:hypothetical protein
MVLLIMDRVSSDVRSKNMSKIRGKNTKLEVRVRKLVWQLGYRYMTVKVKGSDLLLTLYYRLYESREDLTLIIPLLLPGKVVSGKKPNGIRPS